MGDDRETFSAKDMSTEGRATPTAAAGVSHGVGDAELW